MKTLCVNLKGRPETIRLEVAKFVDDQSEFILAGFDEKGEKIANFNQSEVAAWWVE